jgi:thioredoxin 1
VAIHLQKKTSKPICSLFAVVILMITTSCYAATNAERISGKPQALPVSGTVTFLDIGAHKCVPCKMMAPIIKELAAAYEGKVAIAFIDVWEYPEEAKKYNIRTIPTQIFYDANGKEVFRHTGFYNKEEILAQFSKLGVDTGE